MRPKVTQEALAARLAVMGLKIDRVAISKIETGSRSVTDFELVAIAKALGVPLQRLIADEIGAGKARRKQVKKRGQTDRH